MSVAVLCAANVRVPAAHRFGRCPGDLVVFDSDDATSYMSAITALLAVRLTLGIDEIVVLAGGGPDARDDHQLARHAARTLRDVMPAQITIRAAYTDPSATTVVRLDDGRRDRPTRQPPRDDPRPQRMPVDRPGRARDAMSLAVLCPTHVRVPPASMFGRSEPRFEVISNPDGSASAATVRSLLIAVPALAIDEIVCLSGGGPDALDEHQIARHAARTLRAALPASVAIRAAYTNGAATTLVALHTPRRSSPAGCQPDEP